MKNHLDFGRHCAPALALILLSGCTQNYYGVQQPQTRAQTAMPVADAACVKPVGAPPTKGPGLPVSQGRFEASAFAQQEKVSGCAGLLFHIAPDGLPTDVQVLRESPPGYGYGAAGLAALAATRYSPRGGATDWYFAEYTMRFVAGPAPSSTARPPALLPLPLPPPPPALPPTFY